ncbi:MAG: hypothetical protein FRX49_06183 [Trebouxia sp. A1-2]|nr:MAG: hypothetical protein FRX49_06183 [Trebouxia sp. A1-2]
MDMALSYIDHNGCVKHSFPAMTLGGENPNPEEGGRWRNDLGGRGGREASQIITGQQKVVRGEKGGTEGLHGIRINALMEVWLFCHDGEVQAEELQL